MKPDPVFKELAVKQSHTRKQPQLDARSDLTELRPKAFGRRRTRKHYTWQVMLEVGAVG